MGDLARAFDIALWWTVGFTGVAVLGLVRAPGPYAGAARGDSPPDRLHGGLNATRPDQVLFRSVIRDDAALDHGSRAALLSLRQSVITTSTRHRD